jgi:2-C-methyl-D-erythritol 4-phosphate cytidylyltransferase
MPQFAVILAAAGRSSRFNDSHRKKPFVELRNRPVWVRALEPFTNHPDVVQVLVVVSPEDLDWFKEKFRANLAFMNVELVAGGAERADSVQNALRRVRDDVDFVAVHDAARPLIVKAWIEAIFQAAMKSGAAIPAVPISSTLKRGREGLIVETVSRDHLWAAQTPQVFDRRLLMEAFEKRDGFPATDEAQLVERIGHAVTLVETSPLNIKITTQEDFRMAEALLDVLPKEKLPGNLHPFASENPHLFS